MVDEVVKIARQEQIIKIFTGVCILIALTILLRELFYDKITIDKTNILLLDLNLLLIIIVMSTVFIKPKWKIALFFLFIFESLPTFISDNFFSLGMFLYYFALIIGLFFGVFKKNPKRRLFISLIPMLLVFIYLYISKPIFQFTSVLIISIIEFSMIIFSLLLLKQYIEDLLPVEMKFDLTNNILANKSDHKIDLQDLDFNFAEAHIINEILKGKLYKEIGKKLNYSESSIKRKAGIIFEKFNCKTRKDFENNARQYNISFGNMIINEVEITHESQ